MFGGLTFPIPPCFPGRVESPTPSRLGASPELPRTRRAHACNGEETHANHNKQLVVQEFSIICQTLAQLKASAQADTFTDAGCNEIRVCDYVSAAVSMLGWPCQGQSNITAQANGSSSDPGNSSRARALSAASALKRLRNASCAGGGAAVNAIK